MTRRGRLLLYYFLLPVCGLLIVAMVGVGIETSRDPRNSPLAMCSRWLPSASAVQRAKWAEEKAREGKDAVEVVPCLADILADQTALESRYVYGRSLGDAGVTGAAVPGSATTPGAEAAKALVTIGASAVPPLIEYMTNLELLAPDRAAPRLKEGVNVDDLRAKLDSASQVPEVLGKIGKPAFDPLVSALRHPSWGSRYGTAMALGRVGDTAAVPPLASALRDPEPEVRKAAAFALAQLVGTQSWSGIEPRLMGPDDWWRWWQANQQQFLTGHATSVSPPRPSAPARR